MPSVRTPRRSAWPSPASSASEHRCEIEAVYPKIYGPNGTEASIFDYRQRADRPHQRVQRRDADPDRRRLRHRRPRRRRHPGRPAAGLGVRQLVLHPNVVNASDVNEQTENCLYAEGSLICRLMMGTVGLRKVRQNRVLLGDRGPPGRSERRRSDDQLRRRCPGHARHGHQRRGRAGEGAVHADRRLRFGPRDRPRRAAGPPAGHARREARTATMRWPWPRGSRRTSTRSSCTASYFGEGGPNPWGGVEAVLTHLISTVLDVPTAHAPTMSSEALRTETLGRRRAAEGRRGHLHHLPVLRAEGPQPGAAGARRTRPAPTIRR